jgi:hypothetical protein
VQKLIKSEVDYFPFPFSTGHRDMACNAAKDGHKPVKMQSDKYYLKRGKRK